MSSSKRPLLLLVGLHIVAGFLFLSPSYIRPDSVAVQSWLRSAVVNGDFLFFDEWAGFRMLGEGFAYFKEVTPVGALANHWWIGTAILTSPFYVVSHGVSLLLPGESFPDDGFFGLDLATVAWTAVLFHALAMLLAWMAIRRVNANAPAIPRRIVTALACASLGTPAFWYAFRMPIGTHATGMMLVGGLTLLCIRVSDPEDEPLWNLPFVTGLVLGLAIATRVQHVVLVPAVAFAAIAGRRTPKDWLLAFAGTAIPILTQGAAWYAVYGTPLGPVTAGANLEGVTWMPFHRWSLLPVLFSSWRGLFVWSPIWIPAIVGMVMLVRDREAVVRRHAGTILLVMVAGELFANSTLDRYWWGGMSFGPRRFVDLAVPVAIGLHAFLVRTRVAGAVAAWAATAWSALLMVAATARTIDLSRYLSWPDLATGIRDAFSAPVGDALRSPLTSGQLALQSAIALLIIGALTFAASRLIETRPAVAVRASAGFVAVCLVAALVASIPTRARADTERERFGLDTAAARRAGPLIDQRGLISDELAWLEASGRQEEAARTREEIERIDRALVELGVSH